MMTGRTAALRIDFQRTAARSALAPGAVLFVAGVLAAGITVLQHGGAASGLEAAAARLAHLHKASGRAGAGAPLPEDKAAVAALKTARAVTAQLAAPWGDLLTGLEAASGEDVTLLSLQAEPATGAVRASGEARTLKALTDYVRRLEAAGSLAEVSVAGHEAKPQQAGRPVAFSLTARWEVQP